MRSHPSQQNRTQQRMHHGVHHHCQSLPQAPRQLEAAACTSTRPHNLKASQPPPGVTRLSQTPALICMPSCDTCCRPSMHWKKSYSRSSSVTGRSDTSRTTWLSHALGCFQAQHHPVPCTPPWHTPPLFRGMEVGNNKRMAWRVPYYPPVSR